MKIFISPAKKLDFESKIPTSKKSELFFPKKTIALQSKLKKQSPKQLSKLMGLSDSLAQLNWERNQVMADDSNGQSRQALFAFSGDVYQRLDPYTLSPQEIDYLQDCLFILSGLYGMLKPMDLIRPHRLEMGTKFGFNKAKNLYQYWSQLVTDKINESTVEAEVLVNLASDEYFKVVDKKKLKSQVINCHFKEFKDGKLKSIMLWVKQARGMMTRHLANQKANTTETIKGFSLGDYGFDEALSDESNFFFVR